VCFSTGRFAHNQEFNMKLKLELGKAYVNRAGRRVRIICVDKEGAFTVVGLEQPDDSRLGESVRTFWEDGTYGNGDGGSDWDLVAEYNLWRDVAVDTKVWVRDSPDRDWLPRHFAGVTPAGLVAVFPAGATSWSTDKGAPLTPWLYASLTGPEDL
jgi:hypothetical protein